MKTLGVVGGMAGAVLMIVAGVDMLRIQSQWAAEGHEPLIEEVFYNTVGLAVLGLGIFCIMLLGIVAFRESRPATYDKREGMDGKEEAEEAVDDAYAHYKRGDAYDDIQEYEKAIAEYNKAIELNPNYASAYYNRGCANAEMGQYSEAIADYDRALELCPNHFLAYYNRGLVYSRIGENEKAIADYNRAIQVDPDDADAYYSRGLAYNKKREAAKAVSDLEKCIELSTDPELTKAAKQSLREAKQSR